MSKKHTFLLTCALIILTSLICIKYFNNSNTEKELYEINRSLERIEMQMRNTDNINVCLEARKTIQLIKKNIKGLMILEPNYNWLEIQEVLLELERKHCSIGSPKQ